MRRVTAFDHPFWEGISLHSLFEHITRAPTLLNYVLVLSRRLNQLNAFRADENPKLSSFPVGGLSFSMASSTVTNGQVNGCRPFKAVKSASMRIESNRAFSVYVVSSVCIKCGLSDDSCTCLGVCDATTKKIMPTKFA